MALVKRRSSLSPEAELLARSARLQRGTDSSWPIDVDWPRLASLAEREGAAAIMWDWLSREGATGLPADLAVQWHKRAMVATFQTLELERLLHEILDLFGRAGIEVMLLKGCGLVYDVYGSFLKRPMSDLDFLVRPTRAAEAWALLRQEGWTWPADRWPTELYRAHHHLPPLVPPSAGLGNSTVEIHRALLPDGHPFHWPVEGVWSSARPVRVGGVRRAVLAPSVQDQLLHVCVHFAWSHEMRWGSWRALRDVNALIRRQDLSWARFVSAARKARATTCCYWTLRLARDVTQAAIPDRVLRDLRPPRPELVLSRLEQHYLESLFPGGAGCPSDALTNALWELGIAPGWSGHGSARPWSGVERWGSARKTDRSTWVGQVVGRAQHAAAALGYLARLTVPRRLRRA